MMTSQNSTTLGKYKLVQYGDDLYDKGIADPDIIRLCKLKML